MYKDKDDYKCKECDGPMTRRFGFWLYCKLCSFYSEIEGKSK